MNPDYNTLLRFYRAMTGGTYQPAAINPNNQMPLSVPTPAPQEIEPDIQMQPTPQATGEVKQMVYKNEEVKKAGFADIFILSLIVLVYAAIIVNLVLKLK